MLDQIFFWQNILRPNFILPIFSLPQCLNKKILKKKNVDLIFFSKFFAKLLIFTKLLSYQNTSEQWFGLIFSHPRFSTKFFDQNFFDKILFFSNMILTKFLN